jgi:hypothetical protein
MKAIIALILLAAGAVPVAAEGFYGSNNRNNNFGGGSSYGTGSNTNSHSPSGYTTNRGTYVQPYQATNPNNTQFDNYSTRGNVNPYTGQYGTRTPRH